MQRVCENVDEKLIFSFVEKLDPIERPTSDDHVLVNGFGTPNFAAFFSNFEFSHRLQRCGPSPMIARLSKSARGKRLSIGRKQPLSTENLLTGELYSVSECTRPTPHLEDRTWTNTQPFVQ